METGIKFAGRPRGAAVIQLNVARDGVLFYIGGPGTRSSCTNERNIIPGVSAFIPSYLILCEESEVSHMIIISSLNVNTYEVRLLTTAFTPHPLAANSQLRSASQRPPPPYNPRCISSTEIFGDLLAWSASTDPGQILVWNWKTGNVLLVCALCPPKSRSYLTPIFIATYPIRGPLVLQIPR